MTEHVGHGEPGHVCETIDATDALAGIIIRVDPDNPDALAVDSWANGMTREACADILRQLADSWEAEADEARFRAGLN